MKFYAISSKNKQSALGTTYMTLKAEDGTEFEVWIPGYSLKTVEQLCDKNPCICGEHL